MTGFSPLLLVLGFAIGACGTLIGVGGGFLIVPLLLLLYPGELAKTITSITLAVVFFNAFSGTIAYSRLRRVDYRTGIIFALATIPGAVAGALSTAFLSRGLFDRIFATLLFLTAAFLFFHPLPGSRPRAVESARTTRTVVDAQGTVHTYSFNQNLGLVLSFFVGFFSSILGIGGGIIHVPILCFLLNFPDHIATATSHFMLAIMALAGSLTHLVAGDYVGTLWQVVSLTAGVIPGAQLGARLSQRVGGALILRFLALALALVGLRLLFQA